MYFKIFENNLKNLWKIKKKFKYIFFVNYKFWNFPKMYISKY